jgi:hypothetical protein
MEHRAILRTIAMKINKRLVCALILGAASTALGTEQVNFARSTFDLSEWTREAHTKPLNGTEGGAVFILNGTHPQTGGCLEFRWFTPVASIIAGIAFLDEATWDPSTDGAIVEVSAAMVALQMDLDLDTVQSGNLYIEQDGRYFRYMMGSGLDDVVLLNAPGLTASDFDEVFFGSSDPSDPNSNPDFSANGGPIRFGMGQSFAFFDGLLNTNIKTGLDNFSLQITHELPLEPTCPADFNNDGFVNLQDLNILLANFGQGVEPGTDGDVDGDGQVNLIDLNRLLAVFDTECE